MGGKKSKFWNILRYVSERLIGTPSYEILAYHF